jgi:hypothetical protein
MGGACSTSEYEEECIQDIVACFPHAGTVEATETSKATQQ